MHHREVPDRRRGRREIADLAGIVAVEPRPQSVAGPVQSGRPIASSTVLRKRSVASSAKPALGPLGWPPPLDRVAPRVEGSCPTLASIDSRAMEAMQLSKTPTSLQ